MPRPILATILPASLSHNLAAITRRLSDESTQAGRSPPMVWAVIKANAYGHGIANAVAAFERADGLALLNLDEAIQCRQAGWKKPILLLEGFFEPADIALFDRYGLTATLHCQEQLDMLSAARVVHPIRALVKLNSGMNRLGFSPLLYRAAFRGALGLQERNILASVGKMTHFARADDDREVTAAQIRLFNELTHDLPGNVSVCNSAATLTTGLWTSVSADVEQWVRPGICLYGASPFGHANAAEFDLRPAMTLSAQLIAIQAIPADSAVGYGQTFISSHAMTIGIVACGYADGYPRHAPTGTPVSVDGTATRLVGRVSMDMLAVDLTPIPQARVGSRVVMWGAGGPSVDEVARASGTIGYELLCAVAPRVPRRVGNDIAR